MEKKIEKLIKRLPDTSGVYTFTRADGEIVYIGKAANIQRRVKSYFSARKNSKAELIAKETEDISAEKTDTVIEALIREAELIKKFKPRYNIKEKDDRSFLYLVITKDEYPRVLLQRGKDLEKENIRSIFGPFVFALEIRSALKIIRKIFPFSTHTKKEIERGKECFYYQINLCPGTCAKKISKRDYLKEVKNIELFFQGKKKKIIKKLEKEMKKASEEMEFEKARELKRKVDLLTYIQDIAVLKKEREERGIRIEGYDISNISGELAAGAMTVFDKGKLQKKEYRKFKIRNVLRQDDTKMLKEVVSRRLRNDWPLPHFILVDGGKGQVRVVQEALEEEGFSIPVVGIAKGKNRKEEKVIGKIPFGVKKETLVRLQNEAHRFAISYHKKLREKNFHN